MIQVSNLVKTYGAFRLDLSMDVPAGRITGLIGKNGAGKSTAIKAMLGMIRPEEGHAYLLGKEVAALRPEDKQEIGVVLAGMGFCEQLTIRAIASVMEKMYEQFDREQFFARCERLKLPFKKPVREFSSGMKSRLRVALAMSHHAKLLILDEPTVGLDVEGRMELLDMIRSFMAEDEERAVLLTSHIATDLEGLCDDIYLIHNGEVLLHEDTDVIIDGYAVLKVSAERMKTLDDTYLLSVKREPFGYACLTDQKQYYMENAPDVVAERAGIDDLILILTGGE